MKTSQKLAIYYSYRSRFIVDFYKLLYTTDFLFKEFSVSKYKYKTCFLSSLGIDYRERNRSFVFDNGVVFYCKWGTFIDKQGLPINNVSRETLLKGGK